MKRVYNFSPGPAMLPTEMLQLVQAELLDWHGTGMSAMELPHRGQDFIDLSVEILEKLRQLMQIPKEYRILIAHGGGQGQFAAVPMNLMRSHGRAAYLRSGVWSAKAIEEASRYGEVVVVADGESARYTTIPDMETWRVPEYAAYLQYTDNETVNGVELLTVPKRFGLPIVCDMSSSLLTRTLDITQFDVIVAATQKNIAPAGGAVIIIHEAMLEREPFDFTPTIFQYRYLERDGSMPNTPPTFTWYMMGKMLEWIEQQGGIAEMEARAMRRSSLLYNYLDHTGFYHNRVDKRYRSRLNIVFSLENESLNDTFLKEAEQADLTNLKGHRLAGGMRASLYNAMPEAGAKALLEFMQDFERRYG